MNSNDFRPLNERERDAIETAYRKGRILLDNPLTSTAELYVSYEFMQGGFCVCIIKQSIIKQITERYTTWGFRLWRGASRRSYKDPRNPIKGEMRAFSRAILYSHPVEI